jgi:hypothetical protein
MSLLDKASLIVTPNSYKASKLYSVIPSSGAGDMDVVRATTATRVNSAGLIESVAVNIPRIDYTNGSCPSLLLEPQRTNLLLQSNNFTASWVIGSNVTVTSNYAISPDGNTNASRLATSGTFQNVYQTGIATIIGSVYTVSIYAKNTIAGTNQKLRFGSFTVGFSQYTLTDNWKRYTHTYIANTISELIGITNPTPTENFDILTYQFQIELGAYATSYIPTVASTVTRNADVISKTGISSLIGQTEGTVFIEYYNQLISSTILFLNKNTTNSIAIATTPTSIQSFVICNGVQFQLLATGYTVKNQKLKIAISYNSLGYKLFINGILKGTNVNSIIFTAPLTSVNFNDSVVINQNQTIYNNGVQLYKTALTDSECIQLTTL